MKFIQFGRDSSGAHSAPTNCLIPLLMMPIIIRARDNGFSCWSCFSAPLCGPNDKAVSELLWKFESKLLSPKLHGSEQFKQFDLLLQRHRSLDEAQILKTPARTSKFTNISIVSSSFHKTFSFPFSQNRANMKNKKLSYSGTFKFLRTS